MKKFKSKSEIRADLEEHEREELIRDAEAEEASRERTAGDRARKLDLADVPEEISMDFPEYVHDEMEEYIKDIVDALGYELDDFNLRKLKEYYYEGLTSKGFSEEDYEINGNKDKQELFNEALERTLDEMVPGRG